MDSQINSGDRNGFQSQRILVVDDDPFGRWVIAALLNQLGYETAERGNGKEAVVAVRVEPFALVLMDIQMPIMDGYRSVAEIRANEESGRHLPIIAMTGLVTEEDRRRALASGFDDFLPKPIDVRTLEQAVSMQLGRRNA